MGLNLVNLIISLAKSPVISFHDFYSDPDDFQKLVLPPPYGSRAVHSEVFIGNECICQPRRSHVIY